MQSRAVLLVDYDDLHKGHTLSVIKGMRTEGDAVVVADGCKNTYHIPNKYLMYPNEDIEFPLCQEIFSTWGYGKA